MPDTTLICTFYSFEPIVAAATAYSPKKMILVVGINSIKNQDAKEALERTKSLYDSIMAVEVERVNESDLISVATRTVELIENENGKNKVIVNISGAMKLLAQGVLYGCYARRSMVDKIVCNDLSEDKKLVELPKLDYGLSSIKKELLGAIAERKGKPIAEVAKKLRKTRGMLYQHLKELKEMGYVDEKFEVTLAGKLALI